MCYTNNSPVKSKQLPQTYTPEDISNKFTIATSRNWTVKPNKTTGLFMANKPKTENKISYHTFEMCNFHKQ